MSSDNALRQEIRFVFDDARGRILRYCGLYPHENLSAEVLRVCDEAAASVVPDLRLEDARHEVADRCRHLSEAADRFSDRDPLVIAAMRAQAIAAVDRMQDAVFALRRTHTPVPCLGTLLRRRGL